MGVPLNSVWSSRTAGQDIQFNEKKMTLNPKPQTLQFRSPADCPVALALAGKIGANSGPPKPKGKQGAMLPFASVPKCSPWMVTSRAPTSNSWLRVILVLALGVVPEDGQHDKHLT